MVVFETRVSIDGDGGVRMATADGAMLADTAELGNPSGDTVEPWFDPNFWAARRELLDVDGGRGSAWFIMSGSRHWVLRHFRRGGYAARASADRYLWLGERRVRAFAEWRLLRELLRRGLAVPRPVAARYERTGLTYRCDLITRRIDDARTLARQLASRALAAEEWHAVGAAIGRLHDAGVDHADLNAHNILLDGRGVVSIIDFDRGRLRTGPGWRRGGGWPSRNLARLHRSLDKVTEGLPPDRVASGSWQTLLAGYRAGRRGSS